MAGVPSINIKIFKKIPASKKVLKTFQKFFLIGGRGSKKNHPPFSSGERAG
jgi:hypothetical protein